MWELDHKEGWAPKNWWFWTECWRRLVRVPWTARRSNQSILKEISPWCSLEGMMLKLKLQYFGQLMRRVDSLEKTLMLGHGILQARILEWVAFPFSRGSSQPRDQIQASCIAGGFFISWVTREALSLFYWTPVIYREGWGCSTEDNFKTTH